MENDELTVKIGKLVYGGVAIASISGGIVFVTDALCGEVAKIKIFSKKGGYPLAKTVSVIEPSEYRRTPPCPYAHSCGGCDWQHIDYKIQPELKRQIFVECLQRIARLNKIPEIEVFCSNEFNYRIRTQLKVDKNANKIGFFRKMTNEVTKVDYCPVLVDPLNRLLGCISNNMDRLQDELREIKAIAGSDGSVAISPHLYGLGVNRTVIRVEGRSFIVEGDFFFQSNFFLLKELGCWALKFCKGGFFIDLYGGTGFFSIMLADAFEKGITIESTKSQVNVAEKNFENNRLANLNAQCCTAEEFLAFQAKNRAKVDCLIVDPPRPGLSRKVREAIGELAPHQIFYFSCNPSTQARDSAFLVHRCGYSVKRAALFDLYPQTHHMETVLLMEKDS